MLPGSDRISDSIPAWSRTLLAFWAAACDRNIETAIRSYDFIVIASQLVPGAGIEPTRRLRDPGF